MGGGGKSGWAVARGSDLPKKLIPSRIETAQGLEIVLSDRDAIHTAPKEIGSFYCEDYRSMMPTFPRWFQLSRRFIISP